MWFGYHDNLWILSSGPPEMRRNRRRTWLSPRVRCTFKLPVSSSHLWLTRPTPTSITEFGFGSDHSAGDDRGDLFMLNCTVCVRRHLRMSCSCLACSPMSELFSAYQGMSVKQTNCSMESNKHARRELTIFPLKIYILNPFLWLPHAQLIHAGHLPKPGFSILNNQLES